VIEDIEEIQYIHIIYKQGMQLQYDHMTVQLLLPRTTAIIRRVAERGGHGLTSFPRKLAIFTRLPEADSQ